MRARADARVLGLVLSLALLALLVLSLGAGSGASFSAAEIARGAAAAAGLAEPLPGHGQTILELRLWRALVAAGVGAALSLSGALLQGLFRNGLASPSVIGVSAGASLGASLAIVTLGYGPRLLLQRGGGLLPMLVPAAGFAGALVVSFLVLRLSTRAGRVSVPSLLLVGIAINTCIAGAIAAIHSLVLRDFEIARAILTWTFGTLDDRSGSHVALLWAGLVPVAALIPFLATELDLFAGGEDDAEALGVPVARTKILALAGAALAAAVAVAVAGQIAFVGLVVPHLVRLVAGTSHRAVLPLSLVAGALFLLGADVLQRAFLGQYALQPGILMSLIGGPFFLFLLWRHRREVEAW